ncbi:MAG: response regulator [Chloroflexaceae bacterium]|nr:response regulator [Chloroflexaceae bacterium]
MAVWPVTAPAQFDALELDRYTDLHLLSQEQMETIVQLQEVAADVELSLQEMGQAVRGLDRVSRTVQERANNLQMRPLSDITVRFPRILRDWSVQFGKAVNFKLIGAGTLLDRELLTLLSDPLLHLLRNAFDHGIETPEVRQSLGKSPEATITLQAVPTGAQILITISDDGRGIDLEAICDRAYQRGLSPELLANATPEDLLALIFEPGFTTAKEVTEFSGRGVGLDVVRTNLEQVRGKIQVTTELGRGTTFTIALPYNPAILPILLLESHKWLFAIAADSLREITDYQPEQLEWVEGQEWLQWQGQRLRLTRLRKGLQFHHDGQTRLEGKPVIARPSIVVVGQGEEARGVYVDAVWGEQEVAIRRIVSPLPLPPGFVSAGLLGDGRPVPLVDLLALSHWIEGMPTLTMAVGETAKELPETGKQPDAKPVILVVDDSINVRQYLALILERAGYRVEQAKDGQDALEKLLKGLQVRAMLCDIEMPRLDGYGVLTQLRAHKTFRDLPIAMLSSRSNEKHRKLAMNLGASAYLTKPCTDQTLLASIEKLLAGELTAV